MNTDLFHYVLYVFIVLYFDTKYLAISINRHSKVQMLENYGTLQNTQADMQCSMMDCQKPLLSFLEIINFLDTKFHNRIPEIVTVTWG